MLTKNIGTFDRILRIIIGLAIVSLAFIGPKSLYAYAGLILVVTAFIEFCPLYSMIKISSLKKK